MSAATDSIYRTLEQTAAELGARVVRDGRTEGNHIYPWIDVSLDDDNEPLLRLNWGEWGAKDRVVVWPLYDRDHRSGNQDRPRITMAKSKTPAELAKGIRSRILHDCREYWTKTAEYLDSEDRANAGTEATAQRLERYGIESSQNGSRGHYHRKAPEGYPNGYVREVRINYGGKSVDLHLNSLPVATATRIMAIIMTAETVDADPATD